MSYRHARRHVLPSTRIGSLMGAAVLLVLTACNGEPAPPRPTATDDRAIVALDVVPAGAYAPPSSGDVGREARMYDSLTPLGSQVTDADVARGFKSAGLDPVPGDGVLGVERPRPGLEIRRDDFNVPHIVADTDEGALWGVGWASASHAPLIYEAARRNGRLAAAGVPGGDAVNRAIELKVLEPSGAAEALLQRQIDRLLAMGPEGQAVVADIDAFVAGYNARLDASFSLLPRWTRIDIVALSAFKADWWGRGGTRFEAARVDDPPPASVTDVSPSLPLPTRYRSAKASNFALVSGARSTTGHPLMIGGPQVGYMYPGIAFEVVINSPHIDMRGLTAPAYPGYVFVGRGNDFAWTLNVAFDAETGVRRSVRLCDGGAGYEGPAGCQPFVVTPLGSLFDVADLLAPAQAVTMTSTVYGPVDSVDAAGGVAYVITRPGLGNDVDDLLGFRAVNRGEVRGPAAFRRAMQHSPQAFYIGYVDADHIAAFRTCWCVRPGAPLAPVTDLDTLVTPAAELPSTVDPAGGVITNWNEPMVTTPDGDWVPPGPGRDRHDWYAAFERTPVHSATSMVATMNGEATSTSFGQVAFRDLLPQSGGSRPPVITWTNRSTAIQMVMSFGSGPSGG